MNVTDKHAGRFWAKVDKSGDCWLWTGARTPQGYGRFSVDRRSCPATRVAYVLSFGAFEGSLFVCHRCDNPQCVRPDHLFLGTARDNSQDMMRKGRHARPLSKRTSCKHGHPWTPENTYRYKSGKKAGARRCRECSRRLDREAYWRRRA